MAKRKKAQSDQVYSYIYGLICITVSLIAFFHERTGILGTFLAGSGNYLFGEYWLLIYFMLALIGLYLILTNTLPHIGNIRVIGLIVFSLSIMLFSAMLANKDNVGKQCLKTFLDNSKYIYKGIYPSGGGLIGTLMFTGITVLTGYFGALLCLIILLILSFMLIFDFKKIVDSVKSLFNDQKKAAVKRKNQKAREKEKEKEKERARKEKEKLVTLNKKEDLDTLVTEYTPKHEADYNLFGEEVSSKKEKPAKAAAKAEVPEDKPVVTAGTSKKYPNYELPRLTILSSSPIARSNSNRTAAKTKGQRLISILELFGLPCSLQDVYIGPSVTKFELKPERGLNVKKFASIADNLKMELEVKDLRIEAPVPGKNVVGIEIPNVERNTVKMREVLDNIDPKYDNNPLLIALGKDLAGESVVASIDKMPHLLIAGSTGSGKSVCINSIIITLLLRTRPDQVKMLLIDPKKVEFQPYENIPHLIAPVVTDCSEAAGHLEKLTQIMDNRYSTFQNVGVRSITEYNEKADRDPKLDRMYYIVVIVDELADLMLTHGKEVNG
ncbi:MAG: DNA translocase FtsK, partial [Erysipelotrichaceae bacterium]|nr:DNA translocase FtsK [Erysipelotrichaceae bacterium]